METAMTELISTILNNPLYLLLFGGGGVLAIIIAVIAVVVQLKKKDSSSSSITIKKSKETKIRNNFLKDKDIRVEKSEDTTISGNK